MCSECGWDREPDFDDEVKEEKLTRITPRLTADQIVEQHHARKSRVQDKMADEAIYIHTHTKPSIEDKMMMPHIIIVWYVTLVAAAVMGFGAGLICGVWVPK